jgi:hypothetical protein
MNTLKKIILTINIILILSVQIVAQDKNDNYAINNNRFNVCDVILNHSLNNTSSSEHEQRIMIIQPDITGDTEIVRAMPKYIQPVNDPGRKDSDYKENIYLSFGSGISATALHPYSEHNAGVNFQFNAMRVIEETYAIRGDIQYSHNTPINQYSGLEGGHLNTYAIKFNFLLGNFRKANTVNGYAILGGGLNISKISDRIYTYKEYDYSSNSYTGREISSTRRYDAYSYINLDCGGGLAYKLSDKYKIYSEAQYTFPIIYMGRNGGPFLYGILYGSPSLRIGAQIEL